MGFRKNNYELFFLLWELKTVFKNANFKKQCFFENVIALYILLQCFGAHKEMYNAFLFSYLQNKMGTKHMLEREKNAKICKIVCM